MLLVAKDVSKSRALRRPENEAARQRNSLCSCVVYYRIVFALRLNLVALSCVSVCDRARGL
jgi:hypothetical protein